MYRSGQKFKGTQHGEEFIPEGENDTVTIELYSLFKP